MSSTRTVLSLVAAVIINASALAAWEWNVNEQATPGGQVTIVQLDAAQLEEPTPVASLAQTKVDGGIAQTTHRL